MPDDDPVADPDDDLEIADPDQYTQRRRLKQILDAKQHVAEVQRENSRGSRQEDLAKAVVLYGLEIEPLAEQADTDLLDRDVPLCESEVSGFGAPDLTVRDLLETGPEITTGGGHTEYLPVATSRWLRRQFDQFLAAVGLDVSLDDDLPEMDLEL